MIYPTQHYEVLSFKKGDWQDNFGNFWCDMALRGVGEPVRIAVKDPLKYHEGMKLYGFVEEAHSKAGKAYLKFKREEEPEEAPASHTTPSAQTAQTTQPAAPQRSWQPRDDDAIRAQWAIGQAKDWILGNDGSFSNIAQTAKDFYALVDVVKARPQQEPLPPPPDGPDAVYQPLEGAPIDLNDIPF